jgi:hypothetical protein
MKNKTDKNLINPKLVEYLLNIKALNYLKKNNLINNETYKKSIVEIKSLAQL